MIWATICVHNIFRGRADYFLSGLMKTTIVLGAAVGTLLSVLYYLYLAWQDRKETRSLAEYFFWGWRLDHRTVGATIFSSSMSLATVVIALLQLGVFFGIGLSWATITFCLGWIFFLLATTKIRSRSIPRDTIHSYIGRSYGSARLAFVASSATIVGFLGLFATELLAADVIFAALGLTTGAALGGAVLFGTVTIIYAAWGGFRSVIRSDWSQTALLLIAMLVIAGLSLLRWHNTGAPSIMASPQANSYFLPAWTFVGILLINVPFPFVDTSAWQRMLAARSDDDFRKGTVYAVGFFAATWTLLVVVSVIVATSLAAGQDPFAALVDQLAALSTPVQFSLALILFPGLLAAMFSSADGFLNSAAHCFSLDLSEIGQKPEDEDIASRASYNALMLGLAGLTVTLVLRAIGFKIVDLVFAVSAGQIALFPAVLHSLYTKSPKNLPRYSNAAFWSVVLGFLAAWLNGFYSVLASGNTSIWVSWISKLTPPDVYRSTTYAFVVSAVVYVALALFSQSRTVKN
jgi:Na+/proline symporter